jgi:hypothetical protein
MEHFAVSAWKASSSEKRQKSGVPCSMKAQTHRGRNITDRAVEICHVSNHQQLGERMMMSKITLVFALAITAIAMSIPASANQKPAPTPASSSSSTSSGYEDGAYNRGGW